MKNKKVLFIELRKKIDKSKIALKVLKKLPGKNISIGATIQYIELIPTVKNYLKKNKKKIIIKRGASGKPGLVLGCQNQAFDKNADSLLLLADGKFHALNNAVELNREIYVFNTKSLEKISREEIDSIKKKTKIKITKFLNSEKVGVLLSTKKGQKYADSARLIKKLEKKGKRVYLFESDNINTEEFENFPDIQIWINTACPGLSLDDSRILNLRDIRGFIQ